jgi:SAM-dependent methyltransferase
MPRPLRERLSRLRHDPLGVLKGRLKLVYLRLRYGGLEGERARAFWSDRHARYGADDLRGVGRESWSHAENEADYADAVRRVRERIEAEGVDWQQARVLDLGCGVGTYAAMAREAGAEAYVGVDIAETLLPTLRERYPGYRFEQHDLSQSAPAGEFDLIVMIDVTQHLVAPGAYEAAMRHVRERLAPGGVFVVTSWLKGPERLSFFEAARPLSAYQAAFPAGEFEIGRREPFRDKFLFSIRRTSGGDT